MSQTRTGDYTWIDARLLCDATVHASDGVCPDCEAEGECADCDGVIEAGAPAWYCVQNGECVHGTCSPSDAAAKWDDYW